MSNLIEFQVGDLIYPNSNLLFILESPHKNEVKLGYPAAGDTGINMSKILFNINEPLGKLLTSDISLPISLSLMNCSMLPLQESCYEKLQLPDDFIRFLGIHKIKGQSIFDLKNKIKQKLNSPIGKKAVNNFKNRLQNGIDISKCTKLVVCGVIAQCFFDEATSLQVLFRKPKLVYWGGHSFSVYYEYHPSSQSKQWTNSSNMVSLLDYVS
ncbi:hypothetical protein [Plesiomonas shigelloides]|uniref:hypothetical protein n=1 Tax=Plesiomonas shigelloides TaxID=703 RepID=UPI00387EF4C3